MYGELGTNKWDPRTHDVIRKHGLDRERLMAWSLSYQGDMGYIELEYLRHTGMKLYWQFLSYLRDVTDYVTDYNTAMGCAEEVKRIFELLVELDPIPNSGRQTVALTFLDGYNNFVSILRSP